MKEVLCVNLININIDYIYIYIYIYNIIISEFRHDQGNRRSAMLI